MKLTLSPTDRLGPAGRPDAGERGWLRLLVYGLVVPFTLIAVAASGWYVVTGRTPLDLWAGMAPAPRITMAMPARPGPEKPAASLLQPPAAAPQGPPALTPPTPSAAPPSGPSEAASTPAPPPAPSPPGQQLPAAAPAATAPGGPPPITLPTTPPLPATPPAPGGNAADPAQQVPTMAEPIIPPGGDLLAAPSFTQLPSRDDLKPLPAGPLPELLRNTVNGALPIIAGGKEARKVYARPFVSDKPRPKVAIVVTGLGLSKDATNAAIAKLPPEVTLSFSPYASGVDNWIKRARASGHETLLDLPLEPPNFPLHDAGPLAVLAQYAPSEAVNRMEAVLGKAGGYVGVAAALRSPVTASEQWGSMLQALRNRGLLFLGDGLVGVANTNMPAAAAVTLVADETPFRIAIDTRLSRLLLAAQRDGAAVAYVSARPVTFERLLPWIAALPTKDVALAPVSAVVRDPP